MKDTAIISCNLTVSELSKDAEQCGGMMSIHPLRQRREVRERTLNYGYILALFTA